MKPYGREKKVTAKWKRDVYPHPKHKFVNWWKELIEQIKEKQQ